MTLGICISLVLSIISLILNIITFSIGNKSYKKAKRSLEESRNSLKDIEVMWDDDKPELSMYLTTDYFHNWFD